MLTWGEFKCPIDRQLASGNADDELLAHIDWNGLEAPIVVFEVDRRGRQVSDFVYIT